MAVELHKITRQEAVDFITKVKPTAMLVLNMTSMFYGGYAGGRLAAVVGIIVETVLDEEGYIWMEHDQSLIDQIPVSFARIARKTIEQLPYILLRGHTSEPYFRIIEFLGAVIDYETKTDNNLFPFEIRKEPWQNPQP